MKTNNNNAALYALYTSLYINDIACNSVYDITKYAADKDKETRKIFGALKKRVDNYFTHVRKILKIKELYFLSEYNQYIDEKSEQPMDMLVKTIKGCLRKHHIQDDGLISNTIITNILVEFAVTSVTALSAEMVKEDEKMIGLKGWILSDIQRVTRNFYFWVCRNISDDVLKEMNNIIDPVSSLFMNSICNYNTFETAYEKAVFYEREKNNND